MSTDVEYTSFGVVDYNSLSCNFDCTIRNMNKNKLKSKLNKNIKFTSFGYINYIKLSNNFDSSVRTKNIEKLKKNIEKFKNKLLTVPVTQYMSDVTETENVSNNALNNNPTKTERPFKRPRKNTNTNANPNNLNPNNN